MADKNDETVEAPKTEAKTSGIKPGYDQATGAFTL
jgi:hypothetical protein